MRLNRGSFTLLNGTLSGNDATDSDGALYVASDQRGQARSLNEHCDIGAVEIWVFRLHLPVIME
ncbi:MAG: hypothetical protein IPM53_28300 [Anaerolineaceae bacterium]|nr:hypothetical protein [Anaerolineaceae bacterium]